MTTFADREGHNVLYAEKDLSHIPNTPAAYVEWFENTRMRPVHQGGPERGLVRRMAIDALMAHANPDSLYLEAGCGVGFLSIYLSAKGIRSVGVDISEVAVERAAQLAAHVGVDPPEFRAENLAEMTVPDHTYDGIIGHAALHHFVKYPGIPEEFERVLKPDGKCWFSDGFAENRVYRMFHDTKKMERLGDVLLTKSLIEDTFGKHFDVDLRPFDWFLMMSKFQFRLAPKWATPFVRSQARVHLALDKRIPQNRASLALAGSILATMTPKAR